MEKKYLYIKVDYRQHGIRTCLFYAPKECKEGIGIELQQQ